jgi:phosphoribosyl 1,2-cyclic phosphodiesterase
MASAMKVHFWGVRGSIPSPGTKTARYGGNTSCISIHFDHERFLVLDAGTGIREFGKTIAKSNKDVLILMSHAHWDHIQGFPFFLPLYESGRKVRALITGVNKAVIRMLLEQMDGAHFPVESEKLPSEVSWIDDRQLVELIGNGPTVTRIPTNHPGGSIAFRIENLGRSVVYLTDNELDPPYPKATEFGGFAKFCHRADVLIHDAQYLESDMPHKRGWGHSLVSQACALAEAAEVRHLILYHHDPDRSDDELDAIQEASQGWFKARNTPVLCTAAWEGLQLEL